MKLIIEEPYTADIKLSVIGIRALALATKTAKLEISLSDSKNNLGKSPMAAFREGRDGKRKKDRQDDDGNDSGGDEENPQNADDDARRGKDGLSFGRDNTIVLDQLTRQGRQYEDYDEDEGPKTTTNPNFGKSVKFESIMLARDMLLWPNLVIRVFAEKNQAEETSRIVVPTFLFAESFMP